MRLDCPLTWSVSGGNVLSMDTQSSIKRSLVGLYLDFDRDTRNLLIKTNYPGEPERMLTIKRRHLYSVLCFIAGKIFRKFFGRKF